MSIPIEVENNSTANSSVQITEESSGTRMGSPIALQAGHHKSTSVPGQNTYRATITQSSDPSNIGKFDKCHVKPDSSVNWKIILDKGGVTFTGVPATLPPGSG